ncbi:MAG: metal ABC transporter permease [Minisyncoccia bacterium]|jgi:ABC-type Mn2+/Zn2+ transport system permease subunit
MNYLQIITGIFVGIASGYLGSFMVLRRMALVGDALSHVALPGLALALLFNINPFIGAFAALFVGIVIVWFIENRTHLPTESLIGLFFTFSLAVGILITPRAELLEALFGDISKIAVMDAILAVVLSVLIMVVMRAISKKFTLSTLSTDLASSVGINVSRLNFIFLIMVAVIVALGIKAVGTLLTGALVIIPAISARNITSSLGAYTVGSAIFGLLSLLGGIFISSYFNLAPGPIIVLTSSVIFLVSFVLSNKNS